MQCNNEELNLRIKILLALFELDRKLRNNDKNFRSMVDLSDNSDDFKVYHNRFSEAFNMCGSDYEINGLSLEYINEYLEDNKKFKLKLTKF